MTDSMINSWILAGTILFGMVFSFKGAKEGKGILWHLVSLCVMLTGIYTVSHRQEENFKQDQQAIIRQEVESRFKLTGVSIKQVESSSAKEGYQYELTSDNGQYVVTFDAYDTSGFGLKEGQGESLRGRRNAFEALSSLPGQYRPESRNLIYQNENLYTLEVNGSQWRIILDEGIVRSIIDAEGIHRYQHLEEREEIHE